MHNAELQYRVCVKRGMCTAPVNTSALRIGSQCTMRPTLDGNNKFRPHEKSDRCQKQH